MKNEPLLDHFGGEIEVDHILVDRIGNQFQVIDDNHLGIALFNMQTKTIEKAFPNVVENMQIAGVVFNDFFSENL